MNESLGGYATRWYPSELLKLCLDEDCAVCRTRAGDDAARHLVFIMRKHGSLAGQTVRPIAPAMCRLTRTDSFRQSKSVCECGCASVDKKPRTGARDRKISSVAS